MPRTPHPLPAELGDVFTRADAERHGVARPRTRRADLDRRIHGVRVAGASVDDLATRCRAFAARLDSDVFFSHSTAARLLGAPLPRRLETIETVHVSIPAPRRAPHARGLLGHSRRVEPGDVVERGGLRMSSPARLWCEMASALDLLELVALTDFLLHHRQGFTTAESLDERRRRGDRISRSKLLSAALDLSDDRAESPPESTLRVICVWAGLPRPRANHEVIDTTTGRGLRLDLAWPDRKFALEYLGDYHRSREQWRRDMTRRENLRLGGWTILELNADDLRSPKALVARIRRGLAQSGR